MNNSIFIPNAGRMPSLETLPTLLQKPVALLSTLPCVAGVISGTQQDDSSIMLHIDLTSTDPHAYKTVLDCFKSDGLQTRYLNIDAPNSLVRIKVSGSKSLLN